MVNTLTGPALGRRTTVRNLVHHLTMGRSAVVVGGPKMGKTTLLQQTAADVAVHALHPIVIDLMTDTGLDLERRIPEGPHHVILFLDGCERLLPDPSPVVRQIRQASEQLGPHLRAIVWAGGVAWGEWAMAHLPAFGCPIRYYPLIVLPPKEARPYLKQHWPALPPAELERARERSGGHPYLLSRMVERPRGDNDAFFAELWSVADNPTEHHVLMQLIEKGSWVLLQELHSETGEKVSKTVLDRLAIAGLITRTLVDGAASAAIVSPLLADWVRRTTNGQPAGLPLTNK